MWCSLHVPFDKDVSLWDIVFQCCVPPLSNAFAEFSRCCVLYIFAVLWAQVFRDKPCVCVCVHTSCLISCHWVGLVSFIRFCMLCRNLSDRMHVDHFQIKAVMFWLLAFGLEGISNHHLHGLECWHDWHLVFFRYHHFHCSGYSFCNAIFRFVWTVKYVVILSAYAVRSLLYQWLLALIVLFGC